MKFKGLPLVVLDNVAEFLGVIRLRSLRVASEWVEILPGIEVALEIDSEATQVQIGFWDAVWGCECVQSLIFKRLQEVPPFGIPDHIEQVEVMLDETSELQGANAMGRALHQSKGLKVLKMSAEWRISSSMANSLLDAIFSDSIAVQDLDLSGMGVSLEIDTFKNVISQSERLKSLNLCKMPLFGDAGRILMVLGPKAAEIEYLNLQMTKLGLVGFSSLIPVMHEFTNLRTLNLKSCGIGFLAGDFVKQRLLTLPKLKTLILSSNAIKKVQGEKIAEGLLMVTCSLEALYIDHNLLDTGGAKAMLKVLQTRTSLRTLDLRSNHIEAVLCMKLRAAASSTNIQVLLDDN